MRDARLDSPAKVPVATSRGGRVGRAGNSRPGQRLARASSKPRGLDRLTAVFERWAPPGGWIVAALALVTLSAAAGVILPVSPAGLILQALVGTAGAALVPAWAGLLTWMVGP